MNRDDAGAVAVEAALVVPLLLLLVLGTLDTVLWLREASAVTASVRHGARIASAEPRQAGMADDAAAAVSAAAATLPLDDAAELLVYESGPDGQPVSAGCVSRCVRYRWSAALRSFTRTGTGSWSASLINACPGDPRAMSVGVSLRVRHRVSAPGLLGGAATRTVGDRAVMRFEPLPTRACSGGAG